ALLRVWSSVFLAAVCFSLVRLTCLRSTLLSREGSNWAGSQGGISVLLNLTWELHLPEDASIVASPYVMNCNVTIDSQDLALGKEIASAIRGSNVNGLKGVQTMAFPHEGKMEIACNVESFEDQEVT
ncbi:hypothetical protein E2I00_005102, partial [Balaenoptera physalus]